MINKDYKQKPDRAYHPARLLFMKKGCLCRACTKDEITVAFSTFFDEWQEYTVYKSVVRLCLQMTGILWDGEVKGADNNLSGCSWSSEFWL